MTKEETETGKEDAPAEAAASAPKRAPAKKVFPAKRPTKKKPKDKPKRPLSAYNFFFKEEREKILKVVLAEDPEKVENDPEDGDYLDENALKRLRKEGGKVSFEEMGKIIGQRWKNIDPDRLVKFQELATEDTERYKKEMTAYNSKQEAKMRSEAMKPPAGPYGGSAGKGMPVQGGYPPEAMNPAFANPAMGQAYNPYGGGMDFSGYPAAMGMGGMYGPYGGYGQGMDPSGMSQQMGGAGQGGMDGQYGRGGGQAGMYGMMGGAGGFQGGMMGYG